MNEFERFKFLAPGFLSQKFAYELGGLPTVMPAKAGIQLGTGYFFVFEKVACPLSGSGFRVAPPRESGDHAGLPGMTIE